MSTESCPVDHADRPTDPVSGCPVSVGAAAFDPFGDAYQADPPEAVRWSRDEEPVFYSPSLGYWVVTRYDDVKAVFRDNITFSPSIALEKITPVSDEAIATLERYDYAMNRTLVNEDEPEHMPRRRVLMDPFTPDRLSHHEPMVRRLTREYVDRFVDAGKADLVDEMLWEVPLTVALHFLGVPEEDMATLRKYSIAHTVNTWGRPSPEEQLTVAENVGKFWQYAGTVLDKLRRDPSGDGWMPYSIRKQREFPDVITDSYLHSMMMAGIVAAHETTANAAANALKLLLENRTVWEELCADPGLIPNAVEECLRHSGSVAAWRRLVTSDTTVGGVPIPAGAKLLIVNSSANRDERHFEDPDSVDIRRDNATEHLTFGYGSHQCMGKNLARMELQVFLEELTRRLPHLDLVPGQRFTYVPNTSFRGPEHLWVQWDPAANPERTDPALLHTRHPVRIGEPTTRGLSRTLTVERAEPAARDVVEITLAAPAGTPLPSWSPGAHIELQLGDDVSRQYSLCGDPEDRSRYRIAVLRDPDSRGGSRYVHDELRPGTSVAVRGPRNHFRLDAATRHHVFVAGGIGITPILAMADAVRAAGGSYELHYCGRSADTMALLDRVRRDHGPRLHEHVSDAGTRLDVTTLLAEPADGTRIYACGPQRLLSALDAASAHWPEDALSVEHFTTAGRELDPAVEHAFDVSLADSGLTVRVAPDQTVLAALRAANIDVPSDCEEGLCGTCEAPVLDGEVDHRDVVLTRAERSAGTRMMTCCSRACGASLTLGL
ncbi:MULTISPECIES: cytochrome P450/oxidoreductase [Prauserella salsuginis group]|uniref:Cytochrome P450/oxidoreductase n=1 Tax=Prauserella salsuginis TaxID=387889 RepID=A0ABW6G4M4_9PSEU|nr:MULTISPECIES: cytochrome P450/oxidoreductase [Prauserella salsuginis group]MCR3718098.1 vanillate O-demethylase ferredoxin subunit [Prauserella flava]MCR3732668.1 vanillate O-demethylase ferredoxin subunit [Prauserella salsuginis]